ncbi:hypothetical protein E4U39_004402 [Claviceps sp. Clav50 group G5]|nr:hypothetical protein E4U39_004402 [Claviceps sp. Clav50 group G5]
MPSSISGQTKACINDIKINEDVLSHLPDDGDVNAELQTQGELNPASDIAAATGPQGLQMPAI